MADSRAEEDGARVQFAVEEEPEERRTAAPKASMSPGASDAAKVAGPPEEVPEPSDTLMPLTLAAASEPRHGIGMHGRSPSSMAMGMMESSSYGTMTGTDSVMVSKTSRRQARTRTLDQQHEYAKRMTFTDRILGVCFGFGTVVCLWEAVDYTILNLFETTIHQAMGYLALAAAAAISSVILHYTTARAENFTLVRSFLFALATLVLAISSWGALVSFIGAFLTKKQALGVWVLGGIVFSSLSLAYTLWTRHNTLLDIASCAQSLGLLHGDDDEEDDCGFRPEMVA